MKNLVLCELNRLIRRKANIVLFVIALFVLLLSLKYVEFFGIGFYTPKDTVPLNNINFAPFVIREFHAFMVIIAFPTIFIESFNNEFVNSSYRLIMIRPYSKVKFILAKILSSMVIAFIFIMITFTISILYGYIFLPKVEYTNFYNIASDFSAFSAFIYVLKFYLIEYLIIVCVLCISMLISIVMPNSVLAFLGTVLVLIAGRYVNKEVEFLYVSAETIFKVLANLNNSFFVIVITILTFTVCISMISFKKRDYLQ